MHQPLGSTFALAENYLQDTVRGAHTDCMCSFSKGRGEETRELGGEGR